MCLVTSDVDGPDYPDIVVIQSMCLVHRKLLVWLLHHGMLLVQKDCYFDCPDSRKVHVPSYINNGSPSVLWHCVISNHGHLFLCISRASSFVAFSIILITCILVLKNCHIASVFKDWLFHFRKSIVTLSLNKDNTGLAFQSHIFISIDFSTNVCDSIKTTSLLILANTRPFNGFKQVYKQHKTSAFSFVNVWLIYMAIYMAYLDISLRW